MRIKKTLAAIMSMTMLIPSAVTVPLSNVCAEEQSVTDASDTKDETVEEKKEKDSQPNSDDEYIVCDGWYSIFEPEKKVYKIGEELDLSGVTMSGGGRVYSYSNKYPDGVSEIKWNTPERDVLLTDLDLSGFDNTKPGIYEIKVAKIPENFYNKHIDKDKISYASFNVMVVDGEVTEEDKEKLYQHDLEYYNMEGKLELKQPEKTVYKVGEKLDLTGCTLSGSGAIYKCNYNSYSKDYMGEWKIDSRPVTLNDINMEYVNMNKAGTYTIPLDEIDSMNGYDIEKYELSDVYIEITVVENDEQITTTTTPVTTADTGSKKTVIYTGGQRYDVISVNTYPTQTVFLEGEEFNADGLNVKLERYIPYEDMGLNREEYDSEIAEYADIHIATDSMSVIDEKGKAYNASRMCQLPAGKYTVKSEEEAYADNGIQTYCNADEISYEIEIKSSDLLDDKSEPSGDKEVYKFNRNAAQEFAGVLAYPEKTVYSKGEWLDFSGLIIKAKRSIPKDADKYDEEPVFMKTRLPQTDSFIITAEDGTEYRGSKLPLLEVGKYTVSCKGTAMWAAYSDYVNNVDISYDIEIKSDSSATINEKDKKEPDADISKEKGDANMDGTLDLSDAVLIMQTLANPDKYKMTEQGRKNADIAGNNDGITNADALQIQKILLKLV